MGTNNLLIRYTMHRRAIVLSGIVVLLVLLTSVFVLSNSAFVHQAAAARTCGTALQCADTDKNGVIDDDEVDTARAAWTTEDPNYEYTDQEILNILDYWTTGNSIGGGVARPITPVTTPTPSSPRPSSIVPEQTPVSSPGSGAAHRVVSPSEAKNWLASYKPSSITLCDGSAGGPNTKCAADIAFVTGVSDAENVVAAILRAYPNVVAAKTPNSYGSGQNSVAPRSGHRWDVFRGFSCRGETNRW